MPLSENSNSFILNEKEVSSLLCKGYETKQIAGELGLKTRTTADIIRLLKAKHCAINIPHLVANLVRLKLINDA